MFIAMEFVDGTTLAVWQSAAAAGTRCCTWMCRAAGGFEAAHQAGLVHRDFAWTTSFVGKDGRARWPTSGWCASSAEIWGAAAALPSSIMERLL